MQEQQKQGSCTEVYFRRKSLFTDVYHITDNRCQKGISIGHLLLSLRFEVVFVCYLLSYYSPVCEIKLSTCQSLTCIWLSLDFFFFFLTSPGSHETSRDLMPMSTTFYFVLYFFSSFQICRITVWVSNGSTEIKHHTIRTKV